MRNRNSAAPAARRPFRFVRQADDHTVVRVSYEPTLELAVLDVARQLRLNVRGWQDARAKLEQLGFPVP